MRCLVGIDDTDSSRGFCTTYLAYRIASELGPGARVLPYPRLVRLNPNIPFKTRGNAAVCLEVETGDPASAFNEIRSMVESLSDVREGANSGLVFSEDPSKADAFEPLYLDALSGVVSPHRVRAILRDAGVRTFELGNGMGLVGAASSLGFHDGFDHTYELIAYRRREFWGRRRAIDSSSVKEMDARSYPHTFNNYDYQKRKVLVAPHGPDPVFAGIRGDSPSSVASAFGLLRYEEPIDGFMVYLTNQHTDAHLNRALEWKAFSSGWLDGTLVEVRVGPGGHVYLTMETGGRRLTAAAYEPTGDLRRSARLLKPGDRIRASGGVRRGTSLHPMVLNLEKFQVLSLSGRGRAIRRGTYISSPRANRHLTKPLIRYGLENIRKQRAVGAWLSRVPTLPPVPA